MDIDTAIIRQIAMGTVPPGLAAAVLFALLWWRAPAGTAAASQRWRAAACATGLGAMYAGFHAWLFGLRFPPRESMDWLPIAAGVAVIAGLLPAFTPSKVAPGGSPPERFAWKVPLTALALIGWLAAGNLRKSWSAADLVLHVGWFVLLSGSALAGAAVLARRRPGPVAPLTLLVVFAGASQMLVLAYSSLKLGQSAGLWAAFLGGALVVALVRRELSLARGAVFVSVATTAAAVFQGFLFTSTERAAAYAGLIAASAVLAGLGALVPIAKRGPRRVVGALAPVVLALIPVMIGIALAIASSSGADEYEY